jgi:prepilin-type processing-associated H-X9-DG protein
MWLRVSLLALLTTFAMVRAPQAEDKPPVVRCAVVGGLFDTACFGERNHFDPNHDSFAQNVTAPSGQFINLMGSYGWWAPSGGRLAVGDVTMSAYAPINFRTPANFANGGMMVPPATDYNSYLYYNDRKVCAFGSLHPGGANFALADGSTRFVAQTISLTNLQRFCVRNDGQPAQLD